jgi:hypothetical protein
VAWCAGALLREMGRGPNLSLSWFFGPCSSSEHDQAVKYIIFLLLSAKVREAQQEKFRPSLRTGLGRGECCARVGHGQVMISELLCTMSSKEKMVPFLFSQLKVLIIQSD